MEKNSASSKFEAIILNQIYNTNFFNSYVPAINFEYFSCLSSFLSYCSSQKDFQICQQIEDNEIIPKIIAVTSFISDSKNFSCFDKLLLLNDFLKDSLTFKSLTAEKFGASIYSFLDVIVFSGLHNCKLWSKLYRPPSKYQKIESSNKKKSIPNEDEKNDDNSNNSRNNYDSNTNNYKKPLEKLTLWFRIFEETFVDIIKYRFNPTLLDAKHKKQQEKLSKLKKRNPEFINAVKCQDYDKITTLLKEKIDIQVVDEEDGSSAAHIACLKGDLMLCQLLDEYKINWEAEDLENITPVFNAIESANSDLILYLYNNKKVNFEHKDFQNRTPFYHACCFGNLSIISLLYTHCHCNPNSKSNKNRTALSKACFLNKPHVVKYLLSLPPPDFPELDSIDDKGRTALHNAAWGPAGGKEGKYLNGKLITDCPEAAELLLEKGAVTVDFQDFDGNSPFIIAAASQGVESMRVLYRYGADVNKQNIKGETSIFFACRFGHLDSLKVLIEELKASLNVTNNDGLSNLACCLMNDNWEIFDILKEKEFFLKKLDDYQRDFSYLILNKTEKLLLFDALKRLLDFLKEKNLHLKFKEEYIPLVTSFEKKETFGLIFQYFKEQITTNQKEQIFYELIEKLKLSFLIIFEENDKEFFSLFNPNPEFIIRIIKNKKISIDFMENILFETHFDLLKVPNLIHFTIDTHNVPLLITLRNVFSLENKNKIANKFIQNLLSQTKEVKDRKIIEFLLKIDSKTQMNCFEYVKFKKTHDLEKILKDFANVFLKNSDLPIENYCIPYKILEESNKDIDYFHSKKQFLEETNQKITENKNFSSQYFHKTEEENLYFEKILKSPFNFAKKTTFLYIKTEEDLLKMSQEIKKFSVFGIDLEFHCSCPNELFSTDYNEGQISENIVPLTKISGFVCTMQLSTIERDYIIDALYLRDQIGYYLKDFFEDFTKIKLFHGCDYDLQWLKVDLDIEVVNLFDTSKAFMIANNDKKSISLAKLTKHYLNLEMDKSFQKSFWGLRPLPKGMLDYARLDSDVLLGLFSCMLQELEEKSMLGSMAMTCNRMCWEKVEKIKLKKTNMIILKDLKK